MLSVLVLHLSLSNGACNDWPSGGGTTHGGQSNLHPVYVLFVVYQKAIQDVFGEVVKNYIQYMK